MVRSAFCRRCCDPKLPRLSSLLAKMGDRRVDAVAADCAGAIGRDGGCGSPGSAASVLSSAAALSAVLSAGAASEAAAVSPADAHPASASMAAANNKATFFSSSKLLSVPGLPLSYTPDVAKLSHGAGVLGDFCNFFCGKWVRGVGDAAPCRLAVKWMPARGGMGASRPTMT